MGSGLPHRLVAGDGAGAVAGLVDEGFDAGIVGRGSLGGKLQLALVEVDMHLAYARLLAEQLLDAGGAKGADHAVDPDGDLVGQCGV